MENENNKAGWGTGLGQTLKNDEDVPVGVMGSLNSLDSALVTLETRIAQMEELLRPIMGKEYPESKTRGLTDQKSEAASLDSDIMQRILIQTTQVRYHILKLEVIQRMVQL